MLGRREIVLRHLQPIVGTIARYCNMESPDTESEPEPERVKKMRKFSIFRYDPTPGSLYEKSCLETFEVDVYGLSMILDVLIAIKNNIDPSLTFRRSCREGMCGSCAMNINGVNALACLSPVCAYPKRKPVYIYPLPHLYVVRDLVADMSNFYEQYKSIEPWLQRKNIKNEQKVGKQFLQSVRDFNKIDIVATCILCACCSTACPAYWWHGNDTFVGPAILLQAYRWILDSRDNMTRKRICAVEKMANITSCKTIMNCSNVCPKNLNPGLAVAQMKRLLAGWEKKELPDLNPNELHKGNP